MKPPCDKSEIILPEGGQLISYEGGNLIVPSNPIIAVIKGDGVGPEVIDSAMRVIEEATRLAYGGSRKVYWLELTAGKSALEHCGDPLPQATLEAIRMTRAALKGPLETPVGGGYRSVNVLLRQLLGLYANIRPVRWYGQPTPYKHPEKVNVVIFRENTEDLYAGIEWPSDSVEARDFRKFLWERYGIRLSDDTGIGVKPISREATRRIARLAIGWAIRNGRKRVTIVHKGTVMKYTEGSFVKWAYEVALTEFRDHIVTEEDVDLLYDGRLPEDKILVNDRLTDNMLQQLILRPQDYDVLLCPNVSGDLVSEVAVSLVGGIGIAPGLNLGDGIAVAEPAHGTAPRYAGMNVANPTASILSGSLLLRELLGWTKAARLIEEAVERTIKAGFMTQDLARYAGVLEPLGTKEFTDKVIEYMRFISAIFDRRN